MSRSPPPPDGAAPTRDDVDYDDPDVVYDDATARDALRLFVKRALDEHREGGNRARYYELLDATRERTNSWWIERWWGRICGGAEKRCERRR